MVLYGDRLDRIEEKRCLNADGKQIIGLNGCDCSGYAGDGRYVAPEYDPVCASLDTTARCLWARLDPGLQIAKCFPDTAGAYFDPFRIAGVGVGGYERNPFLSWYFAVNDLVQPTVNKYTQFRHSNPILDTHGATYASQLVSSFTDYGCFYGGGFGSIQWEVGCACDDLPYCGYYSVLGKDYAIYRYGTTLNVAFGIDSQNELTLIIASQSESTVIDVAGFDETCDHLKSIYPSKGNIDTYPTNDYDDRFRPIRRYGDILFYGKGYAPPGWFDSMGDPTQTVTVQNQFTTSDLGKTWGISTNGLEVGAYPDPNYDVSGILGAGGSVTLGLDPAPFDCQLSQEKITLNSYAVNVPMRDDICLTNPDPPPPKPPVPPPGKCPDGTNEPCDDICPDGTAPPCTGTCPDGSDPPCDGLCADGTMPPCGPPPPGLSLKWRKFVGCDGEGERWEIEEVFGLPGGQDLDNVFFSGGKCWTPTDERKQATAPPGELLSGTRVEGCEDPACAPSKYVLSNCAGDTVKPGDRSRLVLAKDPAVISDLDDAASNGNPIAWGEFCWTVSKSQSEDPPDATIETIEAVQYCGEPPCCDCGDRFEGSTIDWFRSYKNTAYDQSNCTGNLIETSGSRETGTLTFDAPQSNTKTMSWSGTVQIMETQDGDDTFTYTNTLTVSRDCNYYVTPGNYRWTYRYGGGKIYYIDDLGYTDNGCSGFDFSESYCDGATYIERDISATVSDPEVS